MIHNITIQNHMKFLEKLNEYLLLLENVQFVMTIKVESSKPDLHPKDNLEKLEIIGEVFMKKILFSLF